MKFLICIFFLLPLICLGQTDSLAPLEIKTYYSIDQMIDKILVGNGMRIGNIKITGSTNSIAYFHHDSLGIGLKSGLLISTGNVTDAIGPNKSPGLTSFMGTKGDADLNKIVKGKSQDALVLEFEFVPYHNRLMFNYCFGSEEYREYVGSSFNDGFAFLISGNGLKKKNMAVIPGTNTPVTINNINHKRGISYYVNNDYWENVPLKKKIPFEMDLYMTWQKKLLYWATLRNPKKHQKTIKAEMAGMEPVISEKEKSEISPLLYSCYEYDGFTKVMKAQCVVKPFKKYKIKIVIGDVGDGAYDSGVFIGEKSFSSYKDTTQTNFKDYKDLSGIINWDSMFNIKKVLEIKKAEPELIFPYRIYFDINEFAVSDKNKTALVIMATFLKRNPAQKCQLVGYTDNTGDLEHNAKLAKKRALSVLYYLHKQGVDKKQLLLSGKTYEQPISNPLTEEEQAQHRRVEITLIK